MKRPSEKEFASFYAGYVQLAEGTDMLKNLQETERTTVTLLENLSETQWLHRYAPGKWSIKELIVHVIDAERIFACRALRIARADTTPLPGFDQNVYVPVSNADNRTARSIIEEYQTVRAATLSLFQNFTDEMWDRVGTASDNPVSVRALAYIIAGHETHHINIIKERYL